MKETKDALIIIDMINDFVDPKGALAFPAALNIVPVIEKKREQYDKAGKRTIFIQDWHDEDDLEFNRFPKHAVKGTWGSEYFPPLAKVLDNLVIPIFKKRYSGFYNTDLERLLIGHGITKSVEVCGVCTSICVMDTVGGLANRDYEILIDTKAIADFDEEAQTAALVRMDMLYGAVIY